MTETTRSALPLVRGACGHDCPDTCAWQVEVRDGKAVRMQGDPQHPFTRGVLCAKVNHYLERVYHPDRLMYPLRRTGPKGSGQFERTTWEAALTEIAGRWQAIIAQSGAEAILPYSSAGNQGLIQMSSLDRRLFGRLGCSRLERNICGEVALEGLIATNGSGWGIDPEELVHSRYIVLWATNTIVTNLHLWPVIQAARARGARLVVVDPIRTRTAEQADWHLAPHPASDAALVLAMIHVIIRDGLVDRDYVDRHAEGYAALEVHARQYPPFRVASRTGLSAAEIERFAREYATTQPAVLRPLIGFEHHRNGAMMFRTLACLPVLTGAWRHRGGGLSRSTGSLQASVLNLQGLLEPDQHQPGVRTLNMRDLGRDLCNPQLTPPVRALCVYNSNPAVSIPNQGAILKGLLRTDLFTVVHDLFLTETARYADFVLPATSQLEHLDLVPAWGHHYLSLNQPAIAPLGESRCNTEFFRSLARALGRTEPWLYDSDEQLIRTALDSGHPWLGGISLESLQQTGYARLALPSDWRPFAEGGFPTPSGKARLYSRELLELGLDPLPVEGDVPQAQPGELQLISGKTLHYLNSSYAHVERHRKREGTLFVELHADDATARGIGPGARVEISNSQGTLVADCRISDRVRPGVAWMPFGGNSDAAGNPCSVNLLTPEEPTDWGGGSGFYDTFVRIRPVNPTLPQTPPLRPEPDLTA